VATEVNRTFDNRSNAVVPIRAVAAALELLSPFDPAITVRMIVNENAKREMIRIIVHTFSITNGIMMFPSEG